MTNREFFTAVINANINAEITDFATDAIRKLDERNSKRKSTQTAAQKANETFKAEIADFLTDKEDFVLCSEIAKHFGSAPRRSRACLLLWSRTERLSPKMSGSRAESARATRL